MKKGKQLIGCLLGLSMGILALTSVHASNQGIEKLNQKEVQENRSLSENVLRENETIKRTLDENIPIDIEHFPDNAFRDYLEATYDTDKNGSLSLKERTFSFLELIDLGIKQLDGIQYFPYIKSLKCSGNQLAELDLKQNTLIETLVCSRNNFNNLDINYLSNLKSFTCDNAPLQTIQLPNSVNALSLSNTKTSKLDLALCNQLSRLTLLNIPELESLQLYQGLSFNYFRCQNTGLKSLDLSYTTSIVKDFWLNNNANLTEVKLDNSSFKKLHMYECNLQKLDVSKTTITDELRVNDNKELSEIKLPQSVFKAQIYAHNCQLESIDLSHVQTFQVWLANNVALKEITMGSDTIIDYLYAHKCLNLPRLDLSLAKVKRVWLTGNQQLSDLNTGSNTTLEALYCKECALAHLDLSKNTNLTTLSMTPQILETEKIATIQLEQFYILLNDQVDLSKISQLSYGKLNVGERKIEFDQLPEQDTITYIYETGMGNMEVTIPLYSPYHKVTLHTPGLEPQQVLIDEEGKYSIPSPLYKEGYVFDGWYYDQDYTNPYGNEVIKEDSVLYARYSKLYKVTFVNGDSRMIKEVREGQPLDQGELPEKNGYHFIGWFLSDGVTQWNFETDKIDKDLVLYAHFQKIEDEVTENKDPSDQENEPIIRPSTNDNETSNEKNQEVNIVKTNDSMQIYNYVIAIIVVIGVLWMDRKHWVKHWKK